MTTATKSGSRICRARRSRTAFTLAAIVIAASLPALAFAQGKPPPALTPQARAGELFSKGADAYRRGDFEEAVTLLTEAYRLDPQSVLLYNLARAYEGLGNTDAALNTFSRYLEADPNARDRGAIEQRIATLKRQRVERLAFEKQREDDERRRADAAKAERERKETPPREVVPPPRERSVLPYVIAGVGVAGVATGAVFGLMATSKHSSASASSTPQLTAIDQQASARSYATVATLSFVVGGVLVAAGATWWVIDVKSARRRSDAPPQFRVGLAPGFVVLERGFP